MRTKGGERVSLVLRLGFGEENELGGGGGGGGGE